MSEIRAATVLAAKRPPVTLVISDGLRLAGELALPADRDPAGPLICLHPWRGEDERSDVAAAISFVADAGLPGRWLLGWSFGTELALRWGLDASEGRDIEGAISLSPPLRRPTDAPVGGRALRAHRDERDRPASQSRRPAPAGHDTARELGRILIPNGPPYSREVSDSPARQR